MDNIFDVKPDTYESRLLIGGTWYEKDDVFESRNPATSEVVGTAPICNQGDVDLAIQAARKALESWQRVGIPTRFSMLESLRSLILEEAKEVATLAALETGRSLGEVYATEILWVLEFLRDLGDLGPALVEEKSVGSWRAPALWRGQHRAGLQPLGVSGVITGYGFPLAQPLIQMALALAAGNTVVFKPSELASLTGIRVAALFQAAEFPDGVVNMITGPGETGRFLSEGAVDLVQFSGRRETARAIWTQCSETMPRFDYHCRDNWPLVLLSDGDPEEAALTAAWAACLQGGQTGMTPGRVLVHKSQEQAFTAHLAAAMGNLRAVDLQAQGQVAPLAGKARLARLEELISEAREQGAKACATAAFDVKGNFFPPLALKNVNRDTALWKSPHLGPVLAINTFAEDAAGLREARKDCRGQALSLWTREEGAFLQARHLGFATIWGNDLGFTLGSGRLPWDHSQWVGGLSSLAKHSATSRVQPGEHTPAWRFGSGGEEALENLRHMLHGSWSETLKHMSPTLRALRALRENRGSENA